MKPLFVTVLLALSLAVPAAACPVCPSETGEQVRAGLLDRDWRSGVLATLAPFVVVFGVVAWIHFGDAPRGRK
jgi:hypothetical protein